MPALLTRDVNVAAEALQSGRLVAFATETVYGLGANALDSNAVAKVFAAKNRPHFDPLIVHLHAAEQAGELARQIPAQARALMERFWPGPLTLVLPKRPHVPDLVTAGLPTVALRVPHHELARTLIRTSGVPVAAPSANPFGKISPTTAQHVIESLGNEIDMVLDGGPCRVGVESTVLQILDDAPPVLLRPGGLPIEEIEEIVGPLRTPVRVADGTAPLPGPGMLTKHYAPRKPIIICDSLSQAPSGDRIGLLTLLPVPSPEEYGAVEILSEAGSLTEAAAAFFSALRRLDAANVGTIVATPFPPQGLGRALNDRLQRAAAQ